jgi:hypothetical protein
MKLRRRVTANGNVIYTQATTTPVTHRVALSALVGMVSGAGLLSVGFFLAAGNIMANIANFLP